MENLTPAELNALLLQKLWNRVPCEHWEEFFQGAAGDVIARLVDVCPHGSNGCYPAHKPANLSTTWQGMGEVIEAMAKRGWHYDLCDTRADRVPRAMFWSPKWGGWVTTNANLHRAVALAALEALSQEVG